MKLSPHFMAGWQLRWFEIAGGRMRYWASPGDAVAGKAPKGEVELLGLKVHQKDGMKFDVTTTASGSRTFSLDADSQAQTSSAGWDSGPKAVPAVSIQCHTAQEWVKALEQEAVMARRR
uniref:PH domain-containing protein n=1 Tax=Alexandrium andersonii TaxID=327968 RepID=A0A7S2AF41_9DINO